MDETKRIGRRIGPKPTKKMEQTKRTEQTKRMKDVACTYILNVKRGWSLIGAGGLRVYGCYGKVDSSHNG